MISSFCMARLPAGVRCGIIRPRRRRRRESPPAAVCWRAAAGRRLRRAGPLAAAARRNQAGDARARRRRVLRERRAQPLVGSAGARRRRLRLGRRPRPLPARRRCCCSTTSAAAPRSACACWRVFAADGGRALLVDLGWLPLPGDRRLPEVELPAGEQTLAGLLAPPPGAGLALGPAHADRAGRARARWLLTRVDLPALSAALRPAAGAARAAPGSGAAARLRARPGRAAQHAAARTPPRLRAAVVRAGLRRPSRRPLLRASADAATNDPSPATLPDCARG